MNYKNEEINKISDLLDEIGVNLNYAESANILIMDKLDSIQDISRKRNQTLEQKALDQYELQRNIECYVDLNCLISREIQSVDDKIKVIFDYLRKIK